MASCSYCNSFILFGGQTDHTGRYCNANCQQAGNLLALSHQIPKHQIDQLLWELHHGNCPRCGSPGPVDMHKAHKVWSALVLTSWNSNPELSCRSCAIKRQIGAALFSGVLGWWGFPWGIIMTPVQVVRNIVEMTSGPQPGQPSELLEKYARLLAAANVVQQSQQVPKPPVLGGQAAPPLPGSVRQPEGDERFRPKEDWQLPSRTMSRND
jgi:hypothetical protein